MYIIIKFTQFITKLFPAKLLVRFFYSILIIKGYRRQVINKNYISTIGTGSSNVAFIRFYKKCILNISKIMVETLKFDKLKSSKLTYLKISQLEAKCTENNGLILMTSHYGNWELACINLPFYTYLPCYGVYKPLKNKVFDKELMKQRSMLGLKLVSMNSVARSIATNYKNGTPAIYILIADQNPRSIQNVIWIDFLGVLSAFSNGLIKFQQKYNLPIAYMKTTPGKELFEYIVEFEYPNPNESKESLQWYSKRLENQIHQAPHFWLWSHKRWKRKHELTSN